VTDELSSHLLALWEETVHSRYLFRGMSAKDLTDPLDPSFDPIAPVRGKLRRLLEMLGGLLASGFEFTVHEDYSGLSFDLRDIVAWTKGDLDHPGIDFTSSYESACGYAQNFQGSQVKQNFRYITDHLPQRADDPLLKARMTADDWRLVSEINAWASDESPAHKRIVLWVRRSCPAFESDTEKGPVLGSFEHFCARVLRRMDAQGLPHEIGSVEQVLSQESREFLVRLRRPLYLKDVEKIEEVGDQVQPA
jgi:hypothetical protein